MVHPRRSRIRRKPILIESGIVQPKSWKKEEQESAAVTESALEESSRIFTGL